MHAYYNEIDPKAAAWLRELVRASVIAPGDVDERSIVDVRPADLRGYKQCHFFAGIGVWSYALREAGWQDEREVWTGSCPCQPFSDAGARAGLEDSRHLWPVWRALIAECRPVVVFGEQVASRDGLAWLDFVHADMEAAAYTVGAVDTCAAGVGAPHIRQRLFFVADADGGHAGAERLQRGGQHGQLTEDGGALRLADASINGDRQHARELHGHEGDGSAACLLADTTDAQRRPGERRAEAGAGQDTERRIGPAGGGSDGDVVDAESGGRGERRRTADAWRSGHTDGPGAVNGFWRAVEWLPCTDGKARPVEPGTFPLVTGAPARMVRLRGYGNAINAEVARTFIEAYLDVTHASMVSP